MASSAMRRAAPSTHSHLIGKNIQYLEGSVGYYLSTQARKLGHRNCLRVTHQGVNYTWNELSKEVNALACGFHEMTAKMFSRILLLQPLSVEFIVTMLAAQKAGMIPVVVPHEGLTADRMGLFIQQFTPNIVVSRHNLLTGPGQTLNTMDAALALWPELALTADNAPNMRNKRYSSVRKFVVTNRPLDEAGHRHTEGVLDLRHCQVHGPFGYYENPLRRVAHYLTPDRSPAAVIAHSEHPASRVDDAPELYVASVHTHGNAVNGGRALAATLGLTHNDRVALLPGARASGLSVLAPLACMTSGATLVIPAESMEIGPAKLVERLAFEEPSVVVGTLPVLRMMAAAVGGGDVRVKPPKGQIETLCIYLPPSYTRFATSADLKALTAEGGEASQLKEALGAESVVVVGGPAEAMGYLFASRNGELAVAPNSECRVTSTKGSAVVRRGTQGALHLKGAHVSGLYWNNVGLMSQDVDSEGAIRPGWLATVEEDETLTLGEGADTGATPLIV